MYVKLDLFDFSSAEGEGFEHYMFSTPIGYIFASSNLAQSGFESRNAFLRKAALSLHKANGHLTVSILCGPLGLSTPEVRLCKRILALLS